MTTALQPAAPAALTRQPRTVADIIQTDHVRSQIALALPKFLTPERMMRIAVTTVNRNPDLQKCTPESVLSSLMTASAMGIEPDGRHGHLIARFNSRAGKYECTFQADYKGLVSLVRKSGDVSDVYADYICENDKFSVTKGLHRDLVHEIDIRKPRGAFLGAYSVIVYKEGVPGFDFMSKEEIDDIRDRSDGWKAFKAGKISSTPWATDYNEMAKKTVLKRLLKLADLSGETSERVALDIEATVTPHVNVAPLIPRAQVPVPALPDANSTEPINPVLPAETPAPRRLRPARQAKAQEVPAAQEQEPAPAPTPAQDEMPLPGGEPEPQPAAAAPAANLLPKDAPPLDRLRAHNPDATDAQLLAVLTAYGLTQAEKLTEVSDAALERALEDPGTIAQEVAILIEKEG